MGAVNILSYEAENAFRFRNEMNLKPRRIAGLNPMFNSGVKVDANNVQFV